LAANFYAVPTTNATVVDYLGLTVDDLDCLYWTFPKACVTNPATVFNGKYKLGPE
jgi:hypothetical protein